MGYEVHFKGMPAEMMEKYNKKHFSYMDPINNEYKLALKVYVLKEAEKETNILSDVKNGVFNIKLFLAGLHAEIKQQEEQFAYDRWKEDNMLWYCGWEFSKDYSSHNEQDVYKYVIEKLTLLKFCTETGDYFADNNNFFEKSKEIDEVLEYFEDVMRELKIFEIMNELKEYRIPDNEEDDEDEEYNTPCQVSSFGDNDLIEKPQSLDPVKDITETVEKEKRNNC